MTAEQRGAERGVWFVCRTGGTPKTGYRWFVRTHDGQTIKGLNGDTALFETEIAAGEVCTRLNAGPAPRPTEGGT
jgi:hypothetical protein